MEPSKTFPQRAAEWLYVYAHADDDVVVKGSSIKLKNIPGIPHDDDDVDIIIAVDPGT